MGEQDFSRQRRIYLEKQGQAMPEAVHKMPDTKEIYKRAKPGDDTQSDHGYDK